MTLSDLLSTLTNSNMTAVIKDLSTGAEIVTINARGYDSLEDTLEARTVAQWSIASINQIIILLNEAG